MEENFDLRPHHCGLSVPDMEASIKWYQDVLGFCVIRKVDGVGDMGKLTMMKLGYFRIELFETPNSKPSADLQTEMGQDLKLHGTKHMALSVNDIKKFAEYLESRGVEIMKPPGGKRPPGPPRGDNGPRPMFIRDNSGILIEIVPATAP